MARNSKIPSEFTSAIPFLLGGGPLPMPSGEFSLQVRSSVLEVSRALCPTESFSLRKGVFSCPLLQQLREKESHTCFFPGQGQQELLSRTQMWLWRPLVGAPQDVGIGGQGNC